MSGYDIDKPSKILIKTSSAAKYIKSDIQNIETPRIDYSKHLVMYEKTYLQGSLEGVFKAIQLFSL